MDFLYIPHSYQLRLGYIGVRGFPLREYFIPARIALDQASSENSSAVAAAAVAAAAPPQVRIQYGFSTDSVRI